MIGILVDQLEFVGKGWHSSIRKENHEPDSGCARFGNVYACHFLFLSPYKKKSCKLLLLFFFFVRVALLEILSSFKQENLN